MPTFVPDGGLAVIANRLDGAGTEPVYIAWGTGSGQTGSSTALAVESAESRVAGTSSVVTVDTTDDTYQVQGTLVSLSSQTITEVGLFDASTGGSMFFYSDDLTRVLLTDEGIAFTLRVDFD